MYSRNLLLPIRSWRDLFLDKNAPPIVAVEREIGQVDEEEEEEGESEEVEFEVRFVMYFRFKFYALKLQFPSHSFTVNSFYLK